MQHCIVMITYRQYFNNYTVVNNIFIILFLFLFLFFFISLTIDCVCNCILEFCCWIHFKCLIPLWWYFTLEMLQHFITFTNVGTYVRTYVCRDRRTYLFWLFRMAINCMFSVYKHTHSRTHTYTQFKQQYIK